MENDIRGIKPKLQDSTKKSFLIKANTLFNSSIYIIALCMIFLNIYTTYENANFRAESKKTLKKIEATTRRSLSQVHFLTAGGQIIGGKRGDISYSDVRFKDYIKNILSSGLLNGSVGISNGLKDVFSTPDDMINKSIPLSGLKPFLKKRVVLDSYLGNLFEALKSQSIPEYISAKNIAIEATVIKVDEDGNKITPIIKGIIKGSFATKSWNTINKKWENGVASANIVFSANINPVKDATLDNPFGLVFTNLKPPIFMKKILSQ